MTIASLIFSSRILIVTIGTCEDTLTIVEEIGGTPALKNIENVCIVNNYVRMIRITEVKNKFSLWIEKTETRMNSNVFRFWWLSIAQRASYPNRLITESLNDWIELYDYRRPDQWSRSMINLFISIKWRIPKRV